MDESMNPRIKRLINLAMILVPLMIVLVIGFSDNSLPESWKAVRSMNIKWVILAVLCFTGFLSMDALSLKYFLFRQGYNIRFHDLMFVSIVGQYYSNITPGASGGQPMQVYYLHKKDVPTGMATSAVVVRFFCFQVMLSVIGTVLWIRYGAYIAEHTGGNKWILIVGYIYNVVMVVGVSFLALSKQAIHKLLSWCIRIGTRLHWIRHPESTQHRIEKSEETFHDSLTYFRHNPIDLVIQMLIGGLQLMFLMSVLVMIYHGLGLSGATYGQLVAMNVCEFLAAAYTPLPGASGAQEGVFGLFFGKIFPENLLVAALLLWRFFTYYIGILLGITVITLHGVLEGNSVREAAKASENMLEEVMEQKSTDK